MKDKSQSIILSAADFYFDSESGFIFVKRFSNFYFQMKSIFAISKIYLPLPRILKTTKPNPCVSPSRIKREKQNETFINQKLFSDETSTTK